MNGRCMCGDAECPSCGTAQGTAIGRRCAICGKTGGGGFGPDLRRLRERGYRMKLQRDTAHASCVIRAKRELARRQA